MIPEFDTLDEAVRASFPVQATRAVAVRKHGDAAVVLFDTRPGDEPYLYEVHYQRERGRWSEGSSSNGAGWHRLDPDSDLGIETAWGESPAGADRVRGELDGHVLEEDVVNGAYLLAWWDVPSSDARVTAFRVNGQWVRASTIWEQFQALRDVRLRARDS